MQPNYLCKNIYRTCCCATNCTEQQLVFTFLFPGYRLSCVGWAHEDMLLQGLLNTCNLGTQAKVRGPSIQQRQKLNTSCLPDYTSSAVVEGSWIFLSLRKSKLLELKETEINSSLQLLWKDPCVSSPLELVFIHLHLFARCSCHWVYKSHQN